MFWPIITHLDKYILVWMTMIEEQKGISEAENTLKELGIDQLPIVPSEVVNVIDSDDFNRVAQISGAYPRAG